MTKNSASVTVGTVSGCLIWLVLAGGLLSCLIPLAFFIPSFTKNTALSAAIVGPLVCPASSRAKIETTGDQMLDEYGNVVALSSAQTVCVNSDGQVIARPGVQADLVWGVVVILTLLVLSAVLAFIFAAPAGVIAARIMHRLMKK